MKAVPGHFPPWIRRATVAKRGGTVTHVIAHDAATLVYLAGQNVITLHTWLSRADEPRRPDRVVLDLDPSGSGSAQDSTGRGAAAWEELSDRTFRPDRWTVKNAAARLAEVDPWDGINRHARAPPRGFPSTAS